MELRDRHKLHEVLPLRTPYQISIFVANTCNLKCKYCHQAAGEEKLKKAGFHKGIMDVELFRKTIDGIAEFPDKLKTLLVYGNGEPLLNKNLVEMVRYAKEKHVAERVEVITNGILLNQDMMIKLASAGLDRLRISLQGMDAEMYNSVCGVPFDLSSLINALRDSAGRRNGMKVYVKICDIALPDKEKEEEFYQTFQPIADQCAVEHISPILDMIDYSEMNLDGRGFWGDVPDFKYCSQSFYKLVVDVNGDILPCCHVPVPVIYGNVVHDRIANIFKGGTKSFLLAHLQYGPHSNKICATCEAYKYSLHEDDRLDGHANELLERYRDFYDRQEHHQL